MRSTSGTHFTEMMKIEHTELRARLGRASIKLTPTQALVLCSIYLDDETVSEIARIMHVSHSTVDWHHQAGLAVMRKALWPLKYNDLSLT